MCLGRARRARPRSGSDDDGGEVAGRLRFPDSVAPALLRFATPTDVCAVHFCASHHLSPCSTSINRLDFLVASFQMASKAAPPTGARPSHTLYCSNLPDKLQKDDLKRALYMLFSVYGSILDIVALKTAKMRGQAHVLFRDVSSSTQAMRSLQGFEFFGKEMVRLIPPPSFCCSHRANSRIRKSHMRRQNLTLLPNSTALTNSLLPLKHLPPPSQTVFSSQSSRVLRAPLLLLDLPLR